MSTVQLQIGIQVQLNPRYRNHYPGHNNPYPDTEWFCTGKIISIKNSETYPIKVQWSNGATNVYEKNDLITIEPMKKNEYNLNQTEEIRKTDEAHRLYTFLSDVYYDNDSREETEIDITKLTIANPVFVWKQLFYPNFKHFQEFTLISPEILDICKPEYSIEQNTNIEQIIIKKQCEENSDGNNTNLITEIISNANIKLVFETITLNETTTFKLLCWQNNELNKITEFNNNTEELPIEIKIHGKNNQQNVRENVAEIKINPFFIHVLNN